VNQEKALTPPNGGELGGDLPEAGDLAPEREALSPMWRYLEEEYDYQHPRRGDIYEGVIISKADERIVVNIGAKTEAIVPLSDLERLSEEELSQIQVGDVVPVYVLRPESQEGDVIVSINLARTVQDWERARELFESGELYEGEVVGYNKGGLLVSFGRLQGFVPRSHIVNLRGRTKSGSPLERMTQLVGQQIPLKVIEVSRRRRRLVFSERAAWKEWQRRRKEKLLGELRVGEIHHGTVSSICDFGAFVDLGGADGLIHISELSWDRGVRPRDLLRVGQEVDAYVLRIDRERKRIGLSLKRLRPDPWTTVAERFQVGQLVRGTITNVTDFGAFARLEEGIEGLIHISELADINPVHPRQMVEVGEDLTLRVISLDPERRRIGLSLKQALGEELPLEDVEEEPFEEVVAEEPEEAPEPVALTEETAEGVEGKPLEEVVAEEPEEGPEPVALTEETAEEVEGEPLEEVAAEEPEEALEPV
jgi:small subunit ribosomal protein S1